MSATWVTPSTERMCRERGVHQLFENQLSRLGFGFESHRGRPGREVRKPQ